MTIIFDLILLLYFSLAEVQISHEFEMIRGTGRCSKIVCDPRKHKICVLIKRSTRSTLPNGGWNPQYTQLMTVCEMDLLICERGNVAKLMSMSVCQTHKLLRSGTDKTKKKETHISKNYFPGFSLEEAVEEYQDLAQKRLRSGTGKTKTKGQLLISKDYFPGVSLDEDALQYREYQDHALQGNSSSPSSGNNMKLSLKPDRNSKCPKIKSMVCARCQHNVFRTFANGCYMRLYESLHPKEKLELVSHKACLNSGPVGEMPQPPGEAERNDDTVIDFIHDRASENNVVKMDKNAD